MGAARYVEEAVMTGFKHGDLVQFGGRATDLLCITLVLRRGGKVDRYYGGHCLGGSALVNAGQCRAATAADRRVWADYVDVRRRA